MIKEYLTRYAVRYLTKRLREDKELYYSYQANIAMATYDELRNEYMSDDEIALLHTGCNQGAKRFMDLWIKE